MRAQLREEDPAAWAARCLGFHPDEQQRRVLRSQAAFGILNCSRQWGKSTVAAAKAVYTAYVRPQSTVLITAPSLRQSRELVRKANHFMGKLRGARRRGSREGQDTIHFHNGSRIIGLPGTEETLRGYSAPALVIIDEAAMTPDALYQALRPMLATSEAGSLWLLSTPRAPMGFFWEEWTRAGEEWERVEATAEDCPRISREFLQRERERMPESVFQQEYCCQFNGSDTGLFDYQLVQDAFVPDCEPIELWSGPGGRRPNPQGSARLL